MFRDGDFYSEESRHFKQAVSLGFSGRFNKQCSVFLAFYRFGCSDNTFNLFLNHKRGKRRGCFLLLRLNNNKSWERFIAFENEVWRLVRVVIRFGSLEDSFSIGCHDYYVYFSMAMRFTLRGALQGDV